MKSFGYVVALLSFFSTDALSAPTQAPVTWVPEPVIMLLIGCILVGLAGYGRKRTA
jgi:hypothetical protein